MVVMHEFDNEICTFGLQKYSLIIKGEMTDCGLKHLLKTYKYVWKIFFAS